MCILCIYNILLCTCEIEVFCVSCFLPQQCVRCPKNISTLRYDNGGFLLGLDKWSLFWMKILKLNSRAGQWPRSLSDLFRDLSCPWTVLWALRPAQTSQITPRVLTPKKLLLFPPSPRRILWLALLLKRGQTELWQGVFGANVHCWDLINISDLILHPTEVHEHPRAPPGTSKKTMDGASRNCTCPWCGTSYTGLVPFKFVHHTSIRDRRSMNWTPNFPVDPLKYFQRNLAPTDSKYTRKQHF